MLENLLIARLPLHERSHLLALGDAVQLQPGEVLCEPGARTRHVYFPLDAAVSLVAGAAGAHMLGVGLVGREGMLGAQLALGVGFAPVQAIVQGAVLRCALHRYVQVQMAQLATAAACIYFHLLSARLARWLLMS